MEKLVNLLNEYEAERHKTSVVAEIRKRNEDRLSYLEMNWNYSELLCISKGYGFIKWLVDNDKIEREKLERRPFSDSLVYSDSDCTVRRSDTTYEMLLMLLSIQDNPIEFLVSILK